MLSKGAAAGHFFKAILFSLPSALGHAHPNAAFLLFGGRPEAMLLAHRLGDLRKCGPAQFRNHDVGMRL
ncbi:hypothetical protein BN77_p11163 [Rhizobium mesoamericanum STM3625]|uniref:Uncharacterized protein n=1 Tax=Rhizobium mesoamericanum STM3625 TaxID=1211777 RepID=K0Q250_9HYPH|nr:hypothetical protein BN77_p11163 [Rhizobium mesoamericanum STM3625]